LLGQSIKLEPTKLTWLDSSVTLSAEQKVQAQKDLAEPAGTRAVKDENGRVISAVDKDGNTHQYLYDASGITETVVDPNGRVAVCHLDAKGRLLSTNKDGKSQTYSYECDAAGNIKQTLVLERTSTGAAVLTYDADNRLAKVESNGSRKTLEYENDGRTVRVNTYAGDAMSESKTYKDGRLKECRKADGSREGYDYLLDGEGRVSAITVDMADGRGQKTVLKYDGSGRLISALGNDATRFEKLADAGQAAESIFGFELDKQLAADARLQANRISEQLRIK
jgi:YD repeat-containing protein